MSRIARRTASVCAASLLVGGLLLGAGALAATPKKNARFAGVLSSPPVAGFHAPVRFRVSANGKQLDNFTYGSFGCFGAGGFQPGKNPYTGLALVNVGAIKVAPNGHFSQTKPAGYTVAGQTTTYTVTVSGKFTKHTAATGTIVFTETVSGLPSKCTSTTLAFTATG